MQNIRIILVNPKPPRKYWCNELGSEKCGFNSALLGIYFMRWRAEGGELRYSSRLALPIILIMSSPSALT